jgi:hypothetical protein
LNSSGALLPGVTLSRDMLLLLGEMKWKPRD